MKLDLLSVRLYNTICIDKTQHCKLASDLFTPANIQDSLVVVTEGNLRHEWVISVATSLNVSFLGRRQNKSFPVLVPLLFWAVILVTVVFPNPGAPIINTTATVLL